ncbi:MAG: hypothetical protein IIX99_05955 [Oscillospiraceae bacterium]|nr:hypothetical protein [Oscillospiraceae bacterium]
METVLQNGDYIYDESGTPRCVEGTQELLNRVLFKLGVRRGSFPFYPELGSDLYKLGREKPSARALAARRYAAEALAGEDVNVEDALVVRGEDGALNVTLTLSRGGESFRVNVKAGGEE